MSGTSKQRPLKCPQCRSGPVGDNPHIHLHLGHGLHRMVHGNPWMGLAAMVAGYAGDMLIAGLHKDWRCGACSATFPSGAGHCVRCASALQPDDTYEMRCCEALICGACRSDIPRERLVACDLCGQAFERAADPPPAAPPLPPPPPPRAMDSARQAGFRPIFDMERERRASNLFPRSLVGTWTTTRRIPQGSLHLGIVNMVDGTFAMALQFTDLASKMGFDLRFRGDWVVREYIYAQHVLYSTSEEVFRIGHVETSEIMEIAPTRVEMRDDDGSPYTLTRHPD